MARKRTSCDSCIRRKERCERPSDGGPCGRCQAAGRECTWAVPDATKSKKNNKRARREPEAPPVRQRPTVVPEPALNIGPTEIQLMCFARNRVHSWCPALSTRELDSAMMRAMKAPPVADDADLCAQHAICHATLALGAIVSGDVAHAELASHHRSRALEVLRWHPFVMTKPVSQANMALVLVDIMCNDFRTAGGRLAAAASSIRRSGANSSGDESVTAINEIERALLEHPDNVPNIVAGVDPATLTWPDLLGDSLPRLQQGSPALRTMRLYLGAVTQIVEDCTFKLLDPTAEQLTLAERAAEQLPTQDDDGLVCFALSVRAVANLARGELDEAARLTNEALWLLLADASRWMLAPVASVTGTLIALWMQDKRFTPHAPAGTLHLLHRCAVEVAPVAHRLEDVQRAVFPGMQHWPHPWDDAATVQATLDAMVAHDPIFHWM